MSVLLVILLLGFSFLACATPSAPSAQPISPQTKVEETKKPISQPKPVALDATWQKVVEAAQKEGKLTIYSYNFTSDVGVAVSKGFNNKYGIPVDIITGRGSEIAERIRTEQRIGSAVADLMDANSLQISNLKDAGLTVSSKEIPVLQEKDAWQVNPTVDSQGHILMNNLSYYDAWINTRLVKPNEEPRSLREMAQPKWKGKLIMHDPVFSSAVYEVFIRLLRRNFIDLETLRALGKNVDNFAINAPSAAADVAKGTYAIQPAMSVSTYTPFMVEGAPVKAIPLEEGTVISDLSIAAIKGSPHPNAAKLFNNWLLSQEGQTIYLKVLGGTSARKDVQDFRLPPARTNPIRLIGPTEEDLAESTRLFKERFLVKLWKE